MSGPAGGSVSARLCLLGPGWGAAVVVEIRPSEGGGAGHAWGAAACCPVACCPVVSGG